MLGSQMFPSRLFPPLVRDMLNYFPFFRFLILSVIFLCHGLATGTEIDLPIVNEVISPDGFQRSYVVCTLTSY